MIPRYSRPEMSKIWSDEHRLALWLEVETLALEAMAAEKLVPDDAARALRERGKFSAARVFEIEREVKHDVIAFLTNVAESVGPLSRYMHRGMTSNDLLDTTLAVQLKESGALLSSGIDNVLRAIAARAEEHRYTPQIGRSHGIHAEPITFGLKLLTWYAELERGKARFEEALRGVTVGKLSGAVGTYASLPATVEARVVKALGISAETVATQIVSRDRHAAFMNALALIATSIERFCIEIRHLQRTEVREAEEAFSSGQKGSSAMPHKRNPILTENLSGLARLIRGYAVTAFENVGLWHERDISHSSAERVIIPDACVAMDFMLARFAGVVENLVIHADRMWQNLELSRGLPYSGTLLLALVDHGMTREDAYRLVQKHALPAWEGGPPLHDRVASDGEISKLLTREEIAAIFDLKRHFSHVDMVFSRVLPSHSK